MELLEIKNKNYFLNKAYRIGFISLSTMLLLSGCLYYNAPKQSKKERKQPCWIKGPNCIKDIYPLSASGIGDSEKEAKMEAYKNLAEQIEVQVYNNYEDKSISVYKKYDENISNELKLTTNEKIKFTSIVDKYKTLDGNYHILISVNTKALDSFYDLKIVNEMIKKLKNYNILDINDVNNAKKMLFDADSYIDKINFKLLNRYNASNNQNRAILHDEIYKIKKDLENFEKKIEYYSSLSDVKKRSEYFKIVDNFSKAILQTCFYIKSIYDINVETNRGCEIFLTKDKKGICKEYCGDNPKIKIDKSLTIDDILLLAKNKSLNGFAKKMFDKKRDMLILKHLIDIGDRP